MLNELLSETQIFSSEQNWLKNIEAMYRSDMRLAQLIDDQGPSDHLEIVAARNGGKTVKVKISDSQELYLHSKYDPHKEAKRFIDTLNLDDNFVFIISGFGMGYHVRELFDRVSGETTVIVLEPDLAMLRAALWNIDFSEEIQSRRLIFLHNTDKGLLHKKLTPVSSLMTLGTELAANSASQQWNGKFYAEMRNIITDYISFCRMSFITLLTNCRLTQKNVVNNLVYYVSCPSIDILRQRFKGYPAIVVSAGPSLSKNIELLREAKGKAVIIAVQTVLKTLLNMGIEPDFVTSLDYSEISGRFFRGIEDFGNVHLIAETKVSWAVTDLFTGKKSLLKNEFADMCLGEHAKRREGLKAGATVAHLSFYLAEYIGADPIVMIGQDLGFTDNCYYSAGNPIHEIWNVELNRFYTLEMKEWERIAGHRSILRRVTDIHGKNIYTDEQMFAYLQQFERDFSETASTVIDATEGGAKKRGSVIMTLREVLDKYAEKQIPDTLFSYRDEAEWFDPNPLGDLSEALENRLTEIEEFKSLCSRTIELLNQLQQVVDQPQKFNKLIVEVDEVRSLVNAHRIIMRMVCAVSAVADLRRFRHDRQTRAAGSQGKERALRQLKRDIEFISSLTEGCDQLTEILKEGLERAAVREGCLIANNARN